MLHQRGEAHAEQTHPHRAVQIQPIRLGVQIVYRVRTGHPRLQRPQQLLRPHPRHVRGQRRRGSAHRQRGRRKGARRKGGKGRRDRRDQAGAPHPQGRQEGRQGARRDV